MKKTEKFPSRPDQRERKKLQKQVARDISELAKSTEPKKKKYVKLLGLAGMLTGGLKVLMELFSQSESAGMPAKKPYKPKIIPETKHHEQVEDNFLGDIESVREWLWKEKKFKFSKKNETIINGYLDGFLLDKNATKASGFRWLWFAKKDSEGKPIEGDIVLVGPDPEPDTDTDNDQSPLEPKIEKDEPSDSQEEKTSEEKKRAIIEKSLHNKLCIARVGNIPDNLSIAEQDLARELLSELMDKLRKCQRDRTYDFNSLEEALLYAKMLDLQGDINTLNDMIDNFMQQYESYLQEYVDYAIKYLDDLNLDNNIEELSEEELIKVMEKLSEAQHQLNEMEDRLRTLRYDYWDLVVDFDDYFKEKDETVTEEIREYIDEAYRLANQIEEKMTEIEKIKDKINKLQEHETGQ